MTMPAGLLGPDDYANARRQGLIGLGTGLLAASGRTAVPQNLGQRIGAGVTQGQSAYQGALDQSGTNAMREAQLQQMQAQTGQVQLRQQQEQLAQSGRQRILTENPIPDPKNPDALRQWIDTTLPQWLQVDPDMAGKLAEVRKSIQPREPTPRTVAQVDRGDKVDIIDPTTGAPIRSVSKAVPPSTLMRFGEMTPEARQRTITSSLNSFDRETKDYAKAHDAWAQVDGVLHRAETNTQSSDDIIQLLDGISKLNNPGVGVRVGNIKVQLQKIGSLSDKLRMWIATKGTGVWPTDIVQSIAAAARAIAKEHAVQYNDIRQRTITRGAAAGVDYMDTILPNAWGAGVAEDPANTPPPANTKRLPGETMAAYDARMAGR